MNGGKILFAFSPDFIWKDVDTFKYDSMNKEEALTIFELENEEFSSLPIIIINDEYSSYRKALAEGKTIQYENSKLNEVWNFVDLTEEDLKQRDISTYCINRLRIKPKEPKEPKFKVGDWIESPNGDIRQIYKLFKACPNHVQFSEIQEDGSSELNEWSLWKPKKVNGVGSGTSRLQ